MCNKSESIINLAKALVAFNMEVKIIEKDGENPHFKNSYATLDTIIDEVRPILAKHGLVIMQFPGGDGEKYTLRTMLMHESGEWIESEPLTMKPVKNDPQGIGSCTTYARRYSLSAMLSLNTGEDDDGEKATHGTGSKQESSRTTTETKSGSTEVELANDAQSRMMFAKARDAKVSIERIKDHLGYEVKETKDIRRSDVNKVLKLIDSCKSQLTA